MKASLTNGLKWLGAVSVGVITLTTLMGGNPAFVAPGFIGIGFGSGFGGGYGHGGYFSFGAGGYNGNTFYGGSVSRPFYGRGYRYNRSYYDDAPYYYERPVTQYYYQEPSYQYEIPVYQEPKLPPIDDPSRLNPTVIQPDTDSIQTGP
jgi:hypothetical protein